MNALMRRRPCPGAQALPARSGELLAGYSALRYAIVAPPDAHNYPAGSLASLHGRCNGPTLFRRGRP